MTKLELEMWVRDIVSRVEAAQPDEDHRVELKSQWKDAKEVVRQLAGHANTARGEQILWIIGVDAKNRVVTGADQKELATWLPQLQSEFNEAIYPELALHLNIPIDEKSVVGLLFETDRYPYVIKTHGGRSELEIPWRDGTRTRSAKRSDLLRLLSPLQKLPSVEVLSASLGVHEDSSQNPETKDVRRFLRWRLDLSLYISPRTSSQICIPYHQCYGWVAAENCLPMTNFEKVNLWPRSSPFSGAKSLGIHHSISEIYIEGPGTLQGEVTLETDVKTILTNTIVKAEISLLPIDTEQGIAIKFLFQNPTQLSDKRISWRWNLQNTILTQCERETLRTASGPGDPQFDNV